VVANAKGEVCHDQDICCRRHIGCQPYRAFTGAS
jgi:hypothetical protein